MLKRQIYTQWHTITKPLKRREFCWGWWYMSAIQSSWKAEMGRIVGEAMPCKNLDSFSTNELGMIAHICDPSYEGVISRRIIP
jgi:hypothetical protein